MTLKKGAFLFFFNIIHSVHVHIIIVIILHIINVCIYPITCAQFHKRKEDENYPNIKALLHALVDLLNTPQPRHK